MTKAAPDSYNAPVIIDFHVHIFPPRIREDRSLYLSRDAAFASVYANPKAKMATAEELVASMDRAGVDVSVVQNLGWTSHELCVETNDYIMEAVARYPQRLVGFASLQPQAGEAALKEMERCAQGGLRGLGELRPDAQGFDLGDEALLRPVIDEAKRLGWIILAHVSEPVGHSYPGKGAVTLGMVYRFLTSFPGVPLVCAHWGGGLPFYALMPEVATALAQTYFDTAATRFLYRPQVFRLVGELVGVEKILFGSDYPLLAQGRCLGEIQALKLPEEAKRLIRGGNAERLLRAQGSWPQGG